MTRMACPKNSSAAVASWGSIRASRSAARHVRDRLDEAQEARGLFLMDALSPKIADKRAQGSAARDVLRFVACGSVDDGKSTLIGRLLAETGALALDQIEALEGWSRKFGSAGEKLDYALLLD